jgi:DNA-binding CsgD family transcriptional regulator
MDLLVDDIYEAALIPGRWSGLLTAIEQRFDAIGALLFAHDGKETCWIAGEGGAAPMQAFVDGGWMADNPRLTALFARNHAGFVLDTELFSPEELATLPVYREFFHPAGIFVSAGTHIAGALQDHLVMSVEGFRRPESAATAIPELDALRPHLARAAMIAGRLQLTQARSAVATLEALGVPGAVVGARGELKVANALFAAEIGAGLLEGPTGVRLGDERADCRLRDALAGLRGGRGGRSILVRGQGPAQARILHVLPIVGEANDLFFGAWALLMLTGRRQAAAPTSDLLGQLYDLSPAEARVARALTTGRSIEDIANLAGLSVHTIRNQLKAVLAKTGAARQSELVSILSGLSPPWAHPADDAAPAG